MIFKISIKNLIHKPLSSILSISLLMFSVGIISMLLLMSNYLQEKKENDLKNIDLVIGAKGSPLQLVLSAVYHIDSPTGNIAMSELNEILKDPMIESHIPLAYGDSHKGYRLLGTTHDLVSKYGGELEIGNLFEKPLEVVLGSNVALRLKYKLGDTFHGTHGESMEGHDHDEHDYVIVGILKPTNSVLDNLILSDVPSVWTMHAKPAGMPGTESEKKQEAKSESDDDHEAHDHEDGDHDEDDHEHGEEKTHDFNENDMEITAALVKYRNKMALLMAPRNINSNTKLQAAVPTLEMNRLFNMIGIGTTALQMIAAAIMFISGFSIFFVLFNRMRDRKYELALMRAAGYRPAQLLKLVLTEGVLLSIIGYVLGWLLSRFGIILINAEAAGKFNLAFSGTWIEAEMWLFLITVGVGLIASLMPAIKAMNLDVSTALTEN